MTDQQMTKEQTLTSIQAKIARQLIFRIKIKNKFGTISLTFV